jgi:Flp pilus assembly protein TadG
MRRLLARLRRDEGGAILVITAVAMVAMVGLTGLVIDIGSWDQGQRQAQDAADAAALAGSQDLPGNPTKAATDAQSYVSKNISGATATVTTPYNGSSSEIQVKVTKTDPSFVGKLFGVNSATVGSSAVAKANPGASPAAVFAYNDTCGTEDLVVDANSSTIVGGVQSNGSFWQDGNNDTFGASTYGGPNGCSYTKNGSGSTYAGLSAPTASSALAPWPVNFATNKPACTYSGSSFTWQGDDGATIPSGVYCATGQISINGNNLTGNVTFIASSFNLNGSGENFSSYANNLLIYQTGSNALDINGNDFVSLGYVFAPTASVVLNGNNGSVTGFIEADEVTFNGNGLTFTGTGPSASPGGSSLVQ